MKTEMPLHGIKEELPLVHTSMPPLQSLRLSRGPYRRDVYLSSSSQFWKEHSYSCSSIPWRPNIVKSGCSICAKNAAAILVAIVHKTENEDPEPIIFNNMGEEKAS